MTASLLDPNDSLERRNEKLLKMTSVLMRRVEQSTGDAGDAYAHFQRSLMLEEEVRQRTGDLERTLELLNESNAGLSEATRAAENARANLYNALEAVREGFALFNPDDAMVMCNSRFGMHMPDIKASLCPGLRFRDYVRLVSGSRHLVLPEGRSAEEWTRDRLRLHDNEHVNFNVPFRDGSWIQVSEYRTPDKGTAIIQTDVTEMMREERQERERLLGDQARLVRATLEHINQGICIYDSRERLIGWNRRLVEMLSPPIGIMRVGRRYGCLDDYLEGALEFSSMSPPGTIRRWVADRTGRPSLNCEMKTGAGEFLAVFAQEMPDGGFVISFTDVTAERSAMRAVHAANETLEKRVAERTIALEDALSEAERANASKSRFVAAASHDLLQPLSAAKLFLSSLRNSELSDELGNVVSRAQSALKSVESILGSLLDISKLDSANAAASISTFPLTDVLRPLSDEFAPVARDKGLLLRFVPTSAVVASDPSYLRRILQNLIANAIRYTDSGRVLVGGRRLGGRFRIEVRDTGPGIPEDRQDVVFKEFQRLGKTRATTDGVGLGLAIVERACALLGHPLNLRSVPGRGSVFSITVPLASASADDHSSMMAKSSAVPPAPLDIVAVIVENDRGLRGAMTGLLENWGVSVFDVGGYGEALALLRTIAATPDVLLVDQHLGGDETGVDVVLALRDLLGPLPALLLTAERSAELRRTCRSNDIGFIGKPFEPEFLHSRLSVAARAARS